MSNEYAFALRAQQDPRRPSMSENRQRLLDQTAALSDALANNEPWLVLWDDVVTAARRAGKREWETV